MVESSKKQQILGLTYEKFLLLHIFVHDEKLLAQPAFQQLLAQGEIVDPSVLSENL